MRYQLTRDVGMDECPWLGRDYAAGEVVFRYSGVTYGCISPSGEPVSLDGEIPFFELPRDALEVFDGPEAEAT